MKLFEFRMFYFVGLCMNYLRPYYVNILQISLLDSNCLANVVVWYEQFIPCPACLSGLTYILYSCTETSYSTCTSTIRYPGTSYSTERLMCMTWPLWPSQMAVHKKGYPTTSNLNVLFLVNTLDSSCTHHTGRTIWQRLIGEWPGWLT